MVASWELVPCLVCLRDELNLVAPNRDKRSDGSIGNLAHAIRPSDHNPDETGKTSAEDKDNINEVHAIDIDKDFFKPHFTMDDFIGWLVTECRKPKGKDRGRLKLIIWNEKQYQPYDNWKAHDYHGDNPHTEHAHLSAEYDDKYSRDTTPWGIVEAFGDDMRVDGFTPDAYQELVKAATAGVLSYGNKGEGGVPNIPGDDNDNVLDVIAATYRLVLAVGTTVKDLDESVKTLTNRVAYFEGKIFEATGSSHVPPATDGKITK